MQEQWEGDARLSATLAERFDGFRSAPALQVMFQSEDTAPHGTALRCGTLFALSTRSRKAIDLSLTTGVKHDRQPCESDHAAASGG